MILIVARAGDVHARCVAAELEATGLRAGILDPRTLSGAPSVSYTIGDSCAGRIRIVGDSLIDADEVTAVWYRRPAAPLTPRSVLDPNERRFAQREWIEALDGFLQLLDCPFVNNPSAQRAAAKPRQLAVAAEAGLRIPRTLVTNNPDEAEAFVADCAGPVIHKVMAAPTHTLLETRRWTENDRAALVDLPLVPALFQEEIVGPDDVRATVVGDEVFAARIASSESRVPVDSRLDLDVPFERCEPPMRIRRALLDTLGELGLVFGTVDLKIAADGDYVFLEVNPQGQFLYVEILTGLPITAAVARLLARRG